MGLKQHKWGYENGNIPSGNDSQFANWNMAIDIVDLPWFTHQKWMVFHSFSLVYQRVAIIFPVWNAIVKTVKMKWSWESNDYRKMGNQLLITAY